MAFHKVSALKDLSLYLLETQPIGQLLLRLVSVRFKWRLKQTTDCGDS